MATNSVTPKPITSGLVQMLFRGRPAQCRAARRKLAPLAAPNTSWPGDPLPSASASKSSSELAAAGGKAEG